MLINTTLPSVVLSGAGEFPCDMFRVDQCWQTGFCDAVHIGDETTITGS